MCSYWIWVFPVLRILNKVCCWMNKMFRKFAVVVHTVTGFSRGCSCTCSDRSAKKIVNYCISICEVSSLLFQYSWSEWPTVSVFVKWAGYCFSIREVSGLLFQYSWIERPTVSVILNWAAYCFSILELSGLLFKYSWIEQPTVSVFVNWSAYCFSIREVNGLLFQYSWTE